MAILIFFGLFILAIIIFIMKNPKPSNSHQPQQPQSQQPIHFDLLDENGNQMKEPVIQELQYFCIKDKGYHVTVWPKNNRIGEVLEFTIAGMSYRGNLDDYLGEHVGTLEAEPTNPYDSNAIKILAEDGHHVGYIPKDMTAEVRKSTTLPSTCYFYIGENDGTYFSDAYIKI